MNYLHNDYSAGHGNYTKHPNGQGNVIVPELKLESSYISSRSWFAHQIVLVHQWPFSFCKKITMRSNDFHTFAVSLSQLSSPLQCPLSTFHLCQHHCPEILASWCLFCFQRFLLLLFHRHIFICLLFFGSFLFWICLCYFPFPF